MVERKAAVPIILSLLALVSPILSFGFIVLYHRKTGNSAISALLFGLTIATIFYGYQADSGADIYRHIYWLNLYKGIPIYECFNAGHYDNLFVWDIWCWIIAQFDNPSLLQASGAFVTYGFSSYLIFDSVRKNNGKNFTLIYSLLFLIGLLRARDAVLGIRSSAAFAILSFAVYRRFIQRKNLFSCIVLAVIACLIHLSVGQFLLIFLLMPIFERNYRKILVLLFAFAVGIGALSEWILNYIPQNGTLVVTIITAALSQAYDTAQMVHSLSLNAWINKWCEVVTCIIAGIRVIDYKKGQGESEFQTDYDMLWQFASVCFALNLGYCIGLKQNGDRMLTINEISMIPYLVSIWCHDGILEKKKYLFIDMVLTGAIIVLFLLHVYSLLWGNASSESLITGIIWGIVPTFFNN